MHALHKKSLFQQPMFFQNLNNAREVWDECLGFQKKSNKNTHWVPPVDIQETEKQYLIYLDVPGVEMKDMKINVKGENLNITGSRKALEKDKDVSNHRLERLAGEFKRAFSLPKTVDSEKIDASLSNGVLMVRLPKKQEATEQNIEISVK